MYRQGLGDCFLITFFTGPTPIHMLIDFGSMGEQTTNVKLKAVADDIVATTGGRLAMLVATHEHEDHVNGFGRHKAQFDPPFNVDRVWLAWTEDDEDDVAKSICKFRNDLVTSVTLAVNALAAGPAAGSSLHHGVRELLGFVGDHPVDERPFSAKKLAESVDAAMSWVTTRANNSDRFLHPGTVIEPAWLPGVRVYVLGPPRDKKKINNLGTHGNTELYQLAQQVAGDVGSCAAFAASSDSFAAFRTALEGDERAQFERRLPFDPRFRVETGSEGSIQSTFDQYYDEKNRWRSIETDWLNVTADLALQLDNSTNNTSLVLAIELIADGRVLLFPADAQLGNWLSWHDHTFGVEENGRTRDVKAHDLLARTVLYKVGHHSSHNATLREKGLELMRRDDLVAMIPIDGISASNKWPSATWPSERIYEALCERTVGRVLRSDTGWPAARDRPMSVSKARWNAARVAAERDGVIDVQSMYIDFNLL